MAYIRMISDAEATGELGSIYEQLRSTSGGVANINRIMSLNPGVLRGAVQLRDGFRRGSPQVDGRRREMIATVASSLLQCTYWTVSHGEALRQEMQSGADEQTFAVQLAQDWRALPLNDQEQAMLHFVEQVTVDPGGMDAGGVGSLRAVGFAEEDILQITVVAAWYNFVSRLACALGIELETAKQGSAVLEGLPWEARVGWPAGPVAASRSSRAYEAAASNVW